MKRCPHCKREIENNSVYCEFCGKRLSFPKWPWVLIASLSLLVIVIILVINNGNRKQEMWAEEQYFSNCHTANEYRSYLERYPDGQFEVLALNRISDLMADSIAVVEEEEAFSMCDDIATCRNYMRIYPNGKHFEVVNTMLSRFVNDSINRIRMKFDEGDLTFEVNGYRFVMIYVEGGSFYIGMEGDTTSSPVHRVFLDDYYIGKFVVTQGLWCAVMGEEVMMKGKPAWTSEWGRGELYPAYRVNWYECQGFVDNLNSLLLDELGEWRFSLPTNAQWEFAARGGNKSKNYCFSGTNSYDAIWHEGNANRMTHPVGVKPSNELGLYEMTGNVWEFCKDYYGPYDEFDEYNPQGPPYGVYKVVRGGSWTSKSYELLQTKHRGYLKPEIYGRDLGFRLAMVRNAQ